jgi:hypothetical protein
MGSADTVTVGAAFRPPSVGEENGKPLRQVAAIKTKHETIVPRHAPTAVERFSIVQP